MLQQKPLLGSVVNLWRYPVKSMLGQELEAAEIGDAGLLGDCSYTCGRSRCISRKLGGAF
jgi:uncharacterized protein